LCCNSGAAFLLLPILQRYIFLTNLAENTSNQTKRSERLEAPQGALVSLNSRESAPTARNSREQQGTRAQG